MRLRFAFAVAHSMGLFLTADSFCPASLKTTQSRISTSLRHDTFEDDDFLNSLKGKSPGGGAYDDIPSEDIEGAEISGDMKDKMKSEDESFGGGTRFKALMEKARGSASVEEVPRQLRNPFADNPFAGIEGLDPQNSPQDSPQAEQAAPPAGFENMTVEQQAQMFRAMMQGKQVDPPSVTRSRPDRKVGRNRDADTIQNTADVYFAQLKRDSTVRGIARLRGEDDKADAVFQDPKIEELKSLISKNPHLAGKREEEQKLIEAAAEEMIAFQRAQDIRPSDKAKTGISYKEKLVQRMNKGRVPTAAQTPAPQAQAPAPSPVSQEKKPVELIKPKVQEPVAKQEELPPPVVPQPTPAPVSPQPPQQSVAASAPQQSTSSVDSRSSPDEIRTATRTLMGLILKHRGGPGFGAGGLKGAEIGQYEQLTNEIVALLQDEARSNHAGPIPAVAQARAPPSITQVPETPDTTIAESSGLATVPHFPSGPAQVESMLACIDGAILMYRNSPLELQESVLMTVRAALLSAVNTCNNIMGATNGGIPNTAGAGANVESMLACVEGAIKMYRNSPPEIQQGVLMTLRAALLSAVGTCNKIIAENELQNFKDYKDATGGLDMPEPTPKPVQFYDVVEVADQVSNPKEEERKVAPPATMGPDANAVVLENIYNKMQAAAGSGKLGLREDLTSDEAAALADSIADMRSIMMEELESGIPTAGTVVAAGENSSLDSDSTASMYQKMLAKARAEKAT